MKKKNTAKKAVLPALLAVLCSTAALTSVSYAWFTMGNTAEVGQIDVNVQAADGMQISADAASWKSLLPVEELKDGKLGNQFPTELAPVSTAGTLKDGSLEMFLGTIEKDGGISAVKNTSSFVVFDLYVKLDSKQLFSLAAESSVLDGAKDKDSATAARVAFVNEGVVTTGVAADAQALKAGKQAVIWEPNSEERNTTNNNNKIEGLVSYTGVNQEIKYAGDVRPENYESCFTEVKTKTPAYGANGLTTAQLDLFELEAGINKVRVYIWLEGQDIDCTNEISAGSLSTTLKFAIPAKTENA